MGVTVQDAITARVPGPRTDYVDDMSTGKPALSKRGLVSLPRVLWWIGPLEFCGAAERTLLA